MIAAALLALSLAFVAVNWGAAIISLRNKRLGIRRHISPIPFLAQLFAILGGSAAFWDQRSIIPVWPFIVAPLLDPAFWGLLYVPFVHMRHRP